MNRDQDPYSVRRLQGRARDVFARAARMQDLHGQAQARAMASAPSPLSPPALGAHEAPQQRLSDSAARAVVSAHDRLQQAAQQAQQMALADPVMAKLNARVNGTEFAALPAAGDVLDMDLAEVPAVPEQEAGTPATLPRLSAPDAR